MCRVVVSGFYGFDNAGDEAILHSMVSELRNAYSDIDIVVLSANPSKTAQNFRVKAINRSNVFQIYQAIKHCDLLVSGGGSLYQDVTSVFSPWYYSGIILLAFMLKKPVFAFAQGIGPIRNYFNKKLLKYTMNRTSSISVRDQRSQLELKKLGITKEILCTIDPAFLIKSVPSDHGRTLLEKESGNRDLSRPRIGFSIRTWKGTVDIPQIFAQVADRIGAELGADVVFFPLHYSKDIALVEGIASRMSSNPIVIKGQYSPEELIGLYGLMDLNVCIRFHGLVFSIMNNVPPVAISYDPKIDSLMDSLGVNHLLHYDKLSAESLYSTILEHWKSRGEISAQISDKTREFKVLARKGIEEITGSIKNIAGR